MIAVFNFKNLMLRQLSILFQSLNDSISRKYYFQNISNSYHLPKEDENQVFEINNNIFVLISLNKGVKNT